MNVFKPATRTAMTEAQVRKAAANTAGHEKTLDNDPFKEGDAVVYAAHGVGHIDRIGTEEIAGHSLEVIQVSFSDNQMTLRIPLARARASGLRKIASKEIVDKAMAVIKGKPRISKALWARRAVEIQARINSGDLLQVAEVVRDLQRHVDNLEGSFSERKLFELALDRFGAEIAVVEGVDKTAVLDRLTSTMKAA